MKSHHFGKCSRLIFLYIIGFNVLWRHHHPKIWGITTPKPPGLTPMLKVTRTVVAWNHAPRVCIGSSKLIHKYLHF